MPIPIFDFFEVALALAIEQFPVGVAESMFQKDTEQAYHKK
jgi:hypothetical protein